MLYKIRKFHYLHYEQKELETFLNREAEDGFQLANSFSGFFLFKRTEKSHRYTVRKRTPSGDKKTLPETALSLDRYLNIYPEAYIPDSDDTSSLKVRGHIIRTHAIYILCILLLLPFHIWTLLQQPGGPPLLAQALFALGCLYNVNYLVFYSGEALDYYLCSKKGGPAPHYRRSIPKARLFGAGTFLESVSCICYFIAVACLFFSGEIYIGIILIFLYPLDMIFRYHTASEFFMYFFYLGLCVNGFSVLLCYL